MIVLFLAYSYFSLRQLNFRICILDKEVVMHNLRVPDFFFLVDSHILIVH